MTTSDHGQRGPADAHLLEIKDFDEGFDGDLRQPATCGEALHIAIDRAIEAKRRLADWEAAE